jgi:hypothetical protein
MGGKHARLSPSNHRGAHCPGSVREEAVYPDIPGTAAIDGTGTHLVVDSLINHWIIAGSKKLELIGTIIGKGHEDKLEGWLVDQKRFDRALYALDYVQRRVKELRAEYGTRTKDDVEIIIETETRANPGKVYGRDDWYGTTDIRIKVLKSGIIQYIEIVDFKDGQGFVDAKENSQLIAYCAGTEETKGDLNYPVRMTIVQPRINPPVRYWDTTMDVVRSFAERLSEKAQLTDDPKAPLIPDKFGGKGYCRWCKHGLSGNCKALTNSKEGEDMKTNEEIDRMSPKELSDYILHTQAVAKSADYARDIAVKLSLDGKQIPFFKLQEGTRTISWAVKDIPKLNEIIENFGFNKSIITVNDCCETALVSAKKVYETIASKKQEIKGFSDKLKIDKLIKCMFSEGKSKDFVKFTENFVPEETDEMNIFAEEIKPKRKFNLFKGVK